MNQQDIKHMHTRYMDGVSLTCLARVYAENITKIHEAIRDYESRTAGVPQGAGAKRNRQTKVLQNAHLKPKPRVQAKH